MNFDLITSQKYISYFSANTCNKNDEPFSRFLSDMESVSESIESMKSVSPVESLREIREKTGVKDELNRAVKEWIKPEYNSVLTEFDYFTLLWLCSKRNTLTFSAEYYLKYANDGTIFALLDKIKR